MKKYDPESKDPYPLSRTRIEDFLECPRTFYLQEKFGIKQPSLPGFPLNLAVDYLLKKEFDIHRANGDPHPLMKAYRIKAIPIDHQELPLWRDNFKGIRVIHKPTNFELFGSIDDLWFSEKGEYIVVDYKAISTSQEFSLEDKYKRRYKKQVEFYQWLLRQKGLKVSNVAYFVFCNGLKDREAFDAKLEFDLSIIKHEGDDSWVEPALFEIKKFLDSPEIPKANPECELCAYAEKLKNYEK